MIFRFLFLLLICWVGCQPKVSVRYFEQNEIVVVPESYEEESERKIIRGRYYSNTNQCCRDKENYIPDTTQPLLNREKVIRVNFHYTHAADSSGNNLAGNKAYYYTKELLKESEKRYRNNVPMLLPVRGQDPPVLPTLFHLKWVIDDSIENNRGVYHHYDDKLYYYVTKGKYKNNYNKEVIKKYGVGLDSIMNVFIMPPPPDSVDSPTYKLYSSGIALRNALKITGPSWGAYAGDIAKLFNHELGHNLGLAHAWTGNDGCDDTPKHPNCWSEHSTKKGYDCDTLVSNNVMDYNNYQEAWSPCQIGRIQYNLNVEKGRMRKFLEKEWCTLEESSTVVIQEDTVWEKEIDLYGNLIISDGATLTMMCRTSIPTDGKITIKPNGKLILNNAKIHNDCGNTWKGIIIERRKNSEGSIVLKGAAQLLDIEDWIYE